MELHTYNVGRPYQHRGQTTYNVITAVAHEMQNGTGVFQAQVMGDDDSIMATFTLANHIHPGAAPDGVFDAMRPQNVSVDPHTLPPLPLPPPAARCDPTCPELLLASVTFCG